MKPSPFVYYYESHFIYALQRNDIYPLPSYVIHSGSKHNSPKPYKSAPWLALFCIQLELLADLCSCVPAHTLHKAPSSSIDPMCSRCVFPVRSLTNVNITFVVELSDNKRVLEMSNMDSLHVLITCNWETCP